MVTAEETLASSFQERVGVVLKPLTDTGFTGCGGRPLRCGQTVSGRISLSDCATDDLSTFFDAWTFTAEAGQTVTLDMASVGVDPFLLLLDPLGGFAADDDDSGPASNARIVHRIDRTGEWLIGASGFPGLGEFGDYTLRVSCQGSALLASPSGSCVADAETLCLGDDRFQVRVSWRSLQGGSGMGQAVELTSDTGYFWFFDASNVEMVVKVLSACPVNQRIWVFAGGLTNVAAEITVTDTDSGELRTYSNPLGTPFEPIQDVQAFAACP